MPLIVVKPVHRQIEERIQPTKQQIWRFNEDSLPNNGNAAQQLPFQDQGGHDDVEDDGLD